MTASLWISAVVAAQPAPAQAASDTSPQATDGARTGPTEEAIARQSPAELDRPAKRKWRRSGTPQRFALEFTMGPYTPDVDRNYGGPGLGPYAQVFGRTGRDGVAIGEPAPGLMPMLAFEWQFLYLLGPLGIGTQLGFFRNTARALITDPLPEDESVRSRADVVTFGMLPVAALVVYRFEYGADRFGIPLVPYVRAGPNYTFWWSRDGSGEISRNRRGQPGRGGVWGWQASAGLMLRMDFIEPAAAKKLDQSTGINHFYLLGEYQFSRRDNFGIGNSMSLGAATWFAGVAIEF